MALYQDGWLSGILDYPVYRVESAEDVLLDSVKRSLTYAKVPVADAAAVNDLLSLGFRVIEVNGTFESHGLQADGWYKNAKVLFSHANIVEAEPAHHEALLNIAESCFCWSRFHRDALTMIAADRIKREWLRNCLNGTRGLEVLVARDGNEQPVGFLAVGTDGPNRTVDLLGVAPEHQGKRIGAHLLSECSYRNPDGTLTAGTSLANAAAVSLYQSRGFKLSSASYVLHLHRGVQ